MKNKYSKYVYSLPFILLFFYINPYNVLHTNRILCCLLILLGYLIYFAYNSEERKIINNGINTELENKFEKIIEASILKLNDKEVREVLKEAINEAYNLGEDNANS